MSTEQKLAGSCCLFLLLVDSSYRSSSFSFFFCLQRASLPVLILRAGGAIAALTASRWATTSSPTTS